MNYKNKFYLFIMLFVFLAHASAFSQGVGLSGKRFSVFYNLDVGHSFDGSTVLRSSYGRGLYYDVLEDKKKSFIKAFANLRQTIQIDYNLRRNFSIGLSGGFFRSGFGVEEPDLHSKNYTSFNYGINLKFFSLKRGAMAPLGPYINVRLFNTHNFLHYKGNSEMFGDDHITNESTLNLVGFSVAWGKQGILTGNVLFNFAVEIGIVSGEEISYGNFIDRDFIEGEFDLFSQSFIANHLFKLTFGIGICPF